MTYNQKARLRNIMFAYCNRCML